MKRSDILCAFFCLLVPLVLAGCRSQHSPSSTQSVAVPQATRDQRPAALVTPTTPLAVEVVATASTGDGQSLEAFVAQGEETYRLGVSRGGDAFWLRASFAPNQYGCEPGASDDHTYGCYGPIEIKLADLDADGEPEVVSYWEHDGSGDYKSFHLHRWDGQAYALVGEFLEMGLQVEYSDLDADGRIELVLHYDVGPHQATTPWVDVYTLSGGQLASASDQYPQLYQELLQTYQGLLPRYEAASEDSSGALAALRNRIALAEYYAGGDDRPGALDTLNWPVYASEERDLALRYPASFFFVEGESASGETLWEWNVSFYDQRYQGARPPQTPGIWISAYPNPEGLSAGDWLARHSSAAPSATQGGAESLAYHLWPDEPVQPASVAGREGRSFVGDRVGLRVPTVLLPHGDWMLEISFGDFGPDDLQPLYAAMLETLTLGPQTSLAAGANGVVDCAAVYPGLPGCLRQESLVGGRLAFVDARPPFDHRVTVLDLTHGGAETLGESFNAPRGWSPSGEYLLTTLGEGASAVYSYQGDSLAEYGIPISTPPFWAPADAFPGARDWLARPTEDGALVAIPFPEGETRQVLPPNTLGNNRRVNVRWSADGWLAWTPDLDQLREAGEWEQTLYVQPVQGGAGAVAWTLSDDWRAIYYQILDWAPGTRLILAAKGPLSASLFEDGGELVTINADTGEIVDLNAWMLLAPEAYAWHPSQPGLLALAEGGGRYVFGSKRLALLDLTSGQLGYLTGPELAVFEPAWSPDGVLLAYAAVLAASDIPTDTESALAGRAIYVVAPESGDVRGLTDPGDAVDGWPRWSADGAQVLYTRQHEGYTDVRVVALDGSRDALLVTGLADPTCSQGGCDWGQMLLYSPRN